VKLRAGKRKRCNAFFSPPVSEGAFDKALNFPPTIMWPETLCADPAIQAELCLVPEQAGRWNGPGLLQYAINDHLQQKYIQSDDG
jgi:hypothetical protein